MKIGFLENIENFKRLVGHSDKWSIAHPHPSEININKFDLIVSANYISPNSNYMVIKAMKNKVPTVLLSDGIFEWNNAFKNIKISKLNLNLYHPVMHDYFFCVGKIESKYFNYLGFNTMQYSPKILNLNRPKIPLPGNDIFLITTANTAYYNDSERDRLVDIIKEVTSCLTALRIEFGYRIFDAYLIGKLSISRSINYCDGSFSDVITKFDYVITSPSSIVLESMHHDRPVAQLIYRDSPHILQSGWAIFNKNSIADTIWSMMSENNERMNFQNFQVSEYASGCDFFKEASKLQKQNDMTKLMNQHLLNMLESIFNLNIEYFARKIYFKFKGLKIIKSLKIKVK